ncbi:MAG: LytTR family DNA-binding domain-containing protein [Bacteroidota bacterium]
MIKTVIIDDENRARSILRNVLEKDFPSVNIVGEGDDLDNGVETIKQVQPDLVFLDIHLKSGTGFELLNRLGNIDFEIIFVTAYDEYAIRAFQFSAMGYLLKPIQITHLKDVIGRVSQRLTQSKQNQSDRIKILIENYEDKGSVKKLIIQNINGFQVIPLGEILYLNAEVNYTWFYLQNGEKILVSKTLKEYDKLLTDFGFYRIHQSNLINLRHVKSYQKGEGGTVHMANGEELSVSRRRKTGFLKKFLG